MKKTPTDVVKEVVEMQTNLSQLTVDKINETPTTEIAPQNEINYKEMAKREGVQYIEPKRKLKGFGTLPDKLKAKHAHDWQYVKGIYENYVVNGEPITFWLCLYPGDSHCMWEIPANRPVYIPRCVAKHLEEVQKYHTFSHVPVPETKWGPDQFTDHFSATGTSYRGKFRPIGAFS